MSIIQFLKLIKKNLIFLMMVPIILGSLVFYFTRNEVKNYASSAVVYTGIGSGLSVDDQRSSRLDYFGSKMEFDNIINLFKARETHKDVLIRLFVQGLILDSWDPQYISRASYNRLQERTPQYIKDMVRDHGQYVDRQVIKVPKVMIDTSKLRNRFIIHKNETYRVGNDDDLLSVSNHFQVSVSELMDWNQLTKVKLDLGQSIIVDKKPQVVYTNSFGKRDTTDLFVNDTNFFQRANINESEFEKSVQILKDYSEENDTNYIYELLNYTHPFYSYRAIDKIEVKQIQGSGLVEVNFKTSDPGICKQTIHFLIESFSRNYSKLFENQSDHIIAYFEKRVAESSANLQAAENRLLQFNQDNNIINYYEQTRHISDQKEQLDSRYYDEKMKFTASDSVLIQLEKQIESQKGISLYNSQLLDYRNRLSEITYKIAINELNDSKEPKTVAAIRELKAEAAEIKQKIENDINNAFMIQYSPEGVNSSDILSNWLLKTIEYEESKAKLAALYERKKEFQKTYETFAPLGAKLARIEREIDVYEQQYLSLLRSLNQAKLKQQNLAFKSNIKLVDPPYFPLTPESSKRKIFIVAAAMVGFIMVLFIILVLEYFDETLKTPKRLVKISGLKLFSAYPSLVRKKSSIKYDLIQNRLLEIGAQRLVKLIEDLQLKKENEPIKIIFFSTMKTDGKSLYGDHFNTLLREYNYENVYLNYVLPDDKSKYVHAMSAHQYNLSYRVGKDFFNVKTFSQLLDSLQLAEDQEIPKNLDMLILEIPPIVNYVYSPDLIRDADLAIMVARANRTWQEADRRALEQFNSLLKHPAVSVLNGVNPELLQDLIGELPRKRSRIRRILKKIVRLQFFERYQIRK
jgi:succinoglycan biosynthesis transport protein ExoP